MGGSGGEVMEKDACRPHVIEAHEAAVLPIHGLLHRPIPIPSASHLPTCRAALASTMMVRWSVFCVAVATVAPAPLHIRHEGGGVRNDDTGDRLLKETLKGWRRDRLADLQSNSNALKQLKDEGDTGDTRVDAPPSAPPEDDIPELPSALLELAEELEEVEEAPGPSPMVPPQGGPPTLMLTSPFSRDKVDKALLEDKIAAATSRDTSPTSDAEAPKNLLRIRAGSFSLELEGDADFINTVYDSVRDDLLAKMASAAKNKPSESEPAGIGELNIDEEKIRDIKVKGNGYVWVYVCHELYNKVHVVSRDNLGVTPLASVVDTRRLNKVYVNRARLKELEALIGTGKTLWSELTTEGRRRLRRGSL